MGKQQGYKSKRETVQWWIGNEPFRLCSSTPPASGFIGISATLQVQRVAADGGQQLVAVMLSSVFGFESDFE